MLLKDRALFAAGDGHAPDAGHRPPLRVVKELAVGGFKTLEAALPGHLHGGAARGGRLPDLHAAAAGRAEVDYTAVTRPTRRDVFRLVEGEPARLAPLGADHINLRVTLGPRIESDLPSIGRPARGACERAADAGQLPGVGPVAVAHPDLKTAGAPRGEDDLLAVRRVVGAVIFLRRGDQLDRRVRLTFRAAKSEAPDVAV